MEPYSAFMGLGGLSGFLPVSSGQRYRDYPFADRFGYWPEDERQRGIERLMEEMNMLPQVPAGRDIIDPYGHRGIRDPGSGYYMLKAI